MSPVLSGLTRFVGQGQAGRVVEGASDGGCPLCRWLQDLSTFCNSFAVPDWVKVQFVNT